MTDLELFKGWRWSPRCPPERFHVFVSYTTREEEVRIVKPIVDHFLDRVLRPIIEQTIGEPPAFYDGYWLYKRRGFRFPDSELRHTLKFAIEESEILIAFISPEYFGSEYCRFECTSMAAKEFRPWFDICRKPPIPELSDQRSPDRRPTWEECIRARLLMWQWQSQKGEWRPGGEIVPVLWKGEVDPYIEMSNLGSLPLFDWRSCVSALEAWSRVHDHLLRHGSVSPGWREDAQALDQQCEESMRATAFAIVEILRQRRLEYTRSE